jgi:homoserine acetyltransferase
MPVVLFVAVILLLDHLKIKRAHIVGYSLRGMILLEVNDVCLHSERMGKIAGFARWPAA